TSDYLLDLADADPFPQFTLAYFPNNDFQSHEVGPEEAVEVVEKVDAVLGEFIERRGGMDHFLDEFTIVITGDHSQCPQAEDKSERVIDLSKVLDDYQFPDPGKLW